MPLSRSILQRNPVSFESSSFITFERKNSVTVLIIDSGISSALKNRGRLDPTSNANNHVPTSSAAFTFRQLINNELSAHSKGLFR